jgi:hypothetical protein
MGRDAAGVHYRSDSVRGLFVGEQQALGLLRDYSRTYNERFDGFIVRKFNGDRVRIARRTPRPVPMPRVSPSKMRMRQSPMA